MNPQQLGQTIANLRKRNHLTQDELSDKAGVSYSTISKLECGKIKNPSFFTIARIAKTLEVELTRFTTETPPAHESGITFVYADMNGVMVRFFQRAFVALAKETNVPAELIETTFWHYNDLTNKGDMSLEEFNIALAERLNCKKPIDWLSYYLDAVEPITPMHDCLRDLKKRGIKIGLLTNTMPGFVQALEKTGQMPALDYDSVVDSSIVQSVKPESAIYQIAEEMSGVAPENILFIDDSRPNLVAAEKRGWNVMWFDDYRPAESVKKIYRILEQ